MDALRGCSGSYLRHVHHLGCDRGHEGLELQQGPRTRRLRRLHPQARGCVASTHPGHHSLDPRPASEPSVHSQVPLRGQAGAPVQEQGQGRGGAEGYQTNRGAIPSCQDPGEGYHGQGRSGSPPPTADEDLPNRLQGGNFHSCACNQVVDVDPSWPRQVEEEVRSPHRPVEGVRHGEQGEALEDSEQPLPQ